MYSELKKMKEIDLVKMYRKEKSHRIKSKIFNVILFENKTGGKSWHQNIIGHIKRNKFRLNYYDTGLDENDLYQEITCAFHQMIEKWFDVHSRFGFSTYAWFVDEVGMVKMKGNNVITSILLTGVINFADTTTTISLDLINYDIK